MEPAAWRRVDIDDGGGGVSATTVPQWNPPLVGGVTDRP